MVAKKSYYDFGGIWNKRLRNLYPSPIAKRLIERFLLGDFGKRRDIFGDPDVAANHRAFADGDPSEDGGIRINDHFILYDGVALDAFDWVSIVIHGEAFGAEGYALINLNLLSDDGCFANYHSGSVVYGKKFINLRAGVDVNTGFGVGHFGDDARDERHLKFI